MRQFCKITATAVLLSLGGWASADVGVIDKYECHDHKQTGEYHCHGPADLAKLGGFVLGADTRVQGWSAASGDVFLFAGIAANVEYNYRWFAVTGSYFLMPMVSNVNSDSVSFDDSVVQQGWEIGAKAGPGVGRKGPKFYLTGGWSSATLTDSGNSANNGTLSGYFAGVGMGANTSTLTFDAIATYRDPAPVADYLDEDVLVFDTRLSVGWRF